MPIVMPDRVEMCFERTKCLLKSHDNVNLEADCYKQLKICWGDVTKWLAQVQLQQCLISKNIHGDKIECD